MRFGDNGIQQVVIKVGSSSIVHPDGEVRLGFLGNLITQISRLMKDGVGVTLVTSGAIAMGFTRLGFTQRPSDIPSRQACAAVGQTELMNLYQRLFSVNNIQTGQALITRDDFENRNRYLNARQGLLRLISLGILPIVNENDSVAVEEILYGDNDMLSALVAGLIDADLLVLLTDVEGMYENGDPAKVIATVDGPMDDLLTQVTGSTNGLGSGGMRSKLEAANLCRQSGIHCVIGKSSGSTLKSILAGETVGTYIAPSAKKLESRRRWIGSAAAVGGTVSIDDGAAEALVRGGNSLLPTGVTGVAGDFVRGAVVLLADVTGKEIARGTTRYGSNDLTRIMGHKGSEIESVLGFSYGDEVIHRDQLVVTT